MKLHNILILLFLSITANIIASDVLLKDAITEFDESFPIEIKLLNITEESLEEFQFTLNGVALTKVNANTYTFDSGDLIEIGNVLKILPRGGSISGISTLDLVFLFKGLIGVELGATQAIAGDIDKSGSVTSKDLTSLRLAIVGLRQPESLGDPYLIEKSNDIDDIDMFDYTYSFDEYIFDAVDVSGTDPIEIEVFTHGNLSEARSAFHKTQETTLSIDLQLKDAYLNKGETIDVLMSFKAVNDIAGMGWKLNHENMRLSNVSYNEKELDLVYNNIENHTSFFSGIAHDALSKTEVVLTFEAKEAGFLHNLIQLDDQYSNEIVFADFKVSKMDISFEESQDIGESMVFPNPAVDELTVTLPTICQECNVKLYTQLGQEVQAKNDVSGSVTFDGLATQTGQILFVKVVTKNESFIHKVLIR